MAEKLNDLVKRLRCMAGLSQAQVAELVGRTPGAVGHWESGRIGMSDDAAITFAAALGLPEEDRVALLDAAAEYRAASKGQTPERRLEALERQVADLRADLQSLRDLIRADLSDRDPGA